MKALIESKKSNYLLLGDIQQYIVKKDQQDNSRRQDIIHPSEMAKEDWCPRQTAYRIQGVTPTNKGEVFGHRMLTIFEEGNDIHTKWQSLLIEMGRMWGEWECRVCNRRALGLSPICAGEGFSDAFPSHPPVPMEYREVPLDAEKEWLICGHADGAIPDLNAFIEVKSIGLGTLRIEEPALVRKHTVKTVDGKSVVDYDSLWKDIKRPLASHRKQAILYLAIANLRGWQFDKMIFIYENKANQSTKEFVIPFREENAADLIDVAKDIKWAVEKGKPVPRPANLDKDSAVCKACPFLNHCYGEDHEERSTTRPVAVSLAANGTGGDRTPASTGRRIPRSAQRSNRTQRLRPDESDGRNDEVGGVSERGTRHSRGRRTVRRSRPRQDSGG